MKFRLKQGVSTVDEEVYENFKHLGAYMENVDHCNNRVYIDISTLEELLDFTKNAQPKDNSFGTRKVVIDADEMEITVYDEWLE